MSKVHCHHFRRLAFCKCKVFTCQQVQAEQITEAVHWTGIRRHTLGSPSSWQLLLTVWIMGIYDVTGSSYDTEKQIKSMWQPVTYDTRASNLLSPPFLAQANIQTGLHRRRGVHLHFLFAWSLSMCLCMCVRFTEVSNLSCSATSELCPQLQSC